MPRFQQRDTRGRFTSGASVPATGRIEVSGVRNAMERIKALGGSVLALAQGLHEEGENILTASKEIVPHRHGPLMASGRVYGPALRQGSIEVQIGYGDTAVKYAVPQHERLDYQHAPGREAKYLERPALEAQVGMDARLAARVTNIVRGVTR